MTDAALGRWHAQVDAERRRLAGLRDGVHSRERSRHAVHLLAGRLRAGLLVLLHRAAGLQPQPETAEIVGQVWLAKRELGGFAGRRRRAASITNVVLMGMGEPLANFRNVCRHCGSLMDDFGFDLSRRRVTLSTSGLVPQIYKLAEETNVALAVSLHAPDDASAQRAGADQPQAPDRRAARGVLALSSMSRTAAASPSNM